MSKFSIAQSNPKLTKALNKLNRDMHDDTINLGKRNDVYIQDACDIARIKRANGNRQKTVYIINNDFVTDSRNLVKRFAVQSDDLKIQKMTLNPDFIPKSWL